MTDTDKPNVDAIRGPPKLPSEQPDSFTAKEEVTLTEKQKATFGARRFVDHLLAENLVKEEELRRLRKIEVRYAKLSYARGWQVYLSVVSIVAVAAGGGLISSFAGKSEQMWFGIGWGAIGLGIVLQIGNAIVKQLSIRHIDPD